MKIKDKQEFALLMAKLEVAFFETIPKETVALYVEYLNDLSINQLKRAIDYLIDRRGRRGFPTIAEIRAATLGSTEHEAVQAWGELLNNTYSLNKTFKNPLIAEVANVAFGSMENFFAGDTRNEMADRAHFIRTYKLVANLKEAQAGRRLKRAEAVALLEAKK